MEQGYSPTPHSPSHFIFYCANCSLDLFPFNTNSESNCIPILFKGSHKSILKHLFHPQSCPYFEKPQHVKV